MYCKNCGKQIDENSKFCQFCGATVDGIGKPKAEQNQVSRKSVFDGVVHKCPNCGQVLDSFTAVCPSCGYEIQKEYGEKNAIDIFTENLVSLDSLEKKTAYIENFNVPNTKRDLMEFSDYVVATVKPFNETNEALLVLMNKILYKAEHVFGKDSALYSDFLEKGQKAKQLNDEAKNIEEKAKKEKETAEKKEKRKESVKNAIKNESKPYRFIMLIIGLMLITVGCILICVPKNADGSFTIWAYVGLGVLILAIIELVFVFKKKKDKKDRK